MSQQPMTASAAAEICREAASSWSGCDWTTDDINVWYDDETGEEAGHIRWDCDGMTGDETPEEVAAKLRKRYPLAPKDTIESLAEAVTGYAAQVAEDASSASEDALAAAVALEDGDYARALDRIEHAVHIENQYGDCPTYAAAEEAVRAVIHDRAAAALDASDDA